MNKTPEQRAEEKYPYDETMCNSLTVTLQRKAYIEGLKDTAQLNRQTLEAAYQRGYSNHICGIPRAEMNIDDLLPQVSDGWVSVEDRLPEDGHKVLAYSSFGYAETAIFFTDKKFCKRIDAKPIMKVTHWQPLPTPPQNS